MILLSFFSVLFFLSFKLWCTMHVHVHVHERDLVKFYISVVYIGCLASCVNSLASSPLPIPVLPRVGDEGAFCHSYETGENGWQVGHVKAHKKLFKHFKKYYIKHEVHYMQFTCTCTRTYICVYTCTVHVHVHVYVCTIDPLVSAPLHSVLHFTLPVLSTSLFQTVYSLPSECPSGAHVDPSSPLDICQGRRLLCHAW